jgi:hypothetical protein
MSAKPGAPGLPPTLAEDEPDALAGVLTTTCCWSAGPAAGSACPAHCPPTARGRRRSGSAEGARRAPVGVPSQVLVDLLPADVHLIRPPDQGRRRRPVAQLLEQAQAPGEAPVRPVEQRQSFEYGGLDGRLGRQPSATRRRSRSR